LASFEKASEYRDRCSRHLSHAFKEFGEKKQAKACLDDLKRVEEELDALADFLTRRIDEQMRPLIETYNDLVKK
jgi:hypothetical protein